MKIHLIVVGVLGAVIAANAKVADLRDSIISNILSSKYDRIDVLTDSALVEGKRIGVNPFSPYEILALKVFSLNFEFLSNADSLEYYRSADYYRTVSIPRDGLYLNISRLIANRLHSGDYLNALNHLSDTDRVMVTAVTMQLDTVGQKAVNKYVDQNLLLVGNGKRKAFLEQYLVVEYMPKAWSFNLDFGGGGDVFANGAQNQLKNTGHLGLGLQICRSSICGEWEMQIINAKSKNDFSQNGYTFPKQSGPQIVRSNFDLVYSARLAANFDLQFFGGIAYNAVDIADAQKSQYNVTQNLQGGDFAYTLGFGTDCYLLGAPRSNLDYKIFGIRTRLRYSSLNEPAINNLSGGDISWSIELIMRLLDFVKKEHVR
jgi:hypothetical protein